MTDADRLQLPRPAPGHGSYRYLLNGEATEVIEEFESSAAPDGAVWTTRRAPGGIEITVHATFANKRGDGRGDRGDGEAMVTFRSNEIGKVAARFTVEDGRLTVWRRSPDGAESTETVHLGPGSTDTDTGTDTDATTAWPGVLSPLLRVFQGPAIAHTIRTGGTGVVVLPDITAPGDPERLLQPRVEHRSAQRRGVEAPPARAEGAQASPLRHCRYVGGNYDDAADFWLDDEDRLVRYRFPQDPDHLWEVQLDER